MKRRSPTIPLAAMAVACALALPAAAQESAGPEVESAAWAELSQMLFPGETIADAGDMIAIDAPYRAHDAATVPIEIDIKPPLGRVVERFTIVVDENPAPVAAEVEVGPGMGRTVHLATRVRVNAYSNVRVVAELDDGSMAQSARFVKASGGCSAPATRDAEAAMAAAGRMKLKGFAGDAPEAQLMIRHPNNSGFQIDQVSLLTIPPWFVDTIVVEQDGQLVFRVEGGISLSEDPALRFRYVPNGASAFDVRVEDTEGNVWTEHFPAAAS